MASERPRILIIGGGYIGLYTALRLERKLAAYEAEVTLVNPENFMVYQSLLPEVTSGMLEARHAVVPLRQALRRTRVLTGSLIALDTAQRVATIEPYEGEPEQRAYDHVVLAVGATTKVLPVPGVVDMAVGFTTVTEALFLRNLVLSRMEAAESTDDPDVRRRALTFVFVGGGYSGVEAIGELEDMARSACRYFPSVNPPDMRWILIEAMDRILAMVDEDLSQYATATLRDRGIEVYLDTQLESAEGGHMRLSDGQEFEAETLCWAAGMSPNAVLGQLGLPVDDMGRLPVDEHLQACDVERVWAAGDCAAVPDTKSGGLCPPNAQYALREARRLGDNLAATVRGQELEPFAYRMLGELITVGRYRGIAEIFGRRLKGFLPWYIRRLYHIARIPSPGRKLDVWADWTGSLLRARQIVHMGSEQNPREPFLNAARQSEVEVGAGSGSKNGS